jgi:hypothetical protein
MRRGLKRFQIQRRFSSWSYSACVPIQNHQTGSPSSMSANARCRNPTRADQIGWRRLTRLKWKPG